MKVALFSPFAAARPETGLLYLLGAYLTHLQFEAFQIRCNGIYSLCDRDLETQGRRDFAGCQQCMSESRRLAEWGQLASIELSPFLVPHDIRESKRQIDLIARKDLAETLVDGVRVFALAEQSIRQRVRSVDMSTLSKNDEEIIRRVMIATLRTVMATKRMLTSARSNLLVVAHNQDFISHAVVDESLRSGQRLAVMRWSEEKHVVSIESFPGGQQVDSPVFVEDVVTMRRDVESWPAEIMRQLDDLCKFLAIDNSQLELPLAHAKIL